MDIKTAIAERIAGSNEVVKGRVVDALVEDALKACTAKIVQAHVEWEKGQKTRRRLARPDMVGFDENGNALSSTYSKKALEELDRLGVRRLFGARQAWLRPSARCALRRLEVDHDPRHAVRVPRSDGGEAVNTRSTGLHRKEMAP